MTLRELGKMDKKERDELVRLIRKGYTVQESVERYLLKGAGYHEQEIEYQLRNGAVFYTEEKLVNEISNPDSELFFGLDDEQKEKFKRELTGMVFGKNETEKVRNAPADWSYVRIGTTNFYFYGCA